MRTTLLCCVLAAVVSASCSSERIGPVTEPRGDALRAPETRSLLGRPLYRPEFPPDEYGRLLADLEKANEMRLADPRAEEGFVWQGRRLAYLARYNDAVAVFTEGLGVHPRSARLLRHRGHRLITLRQFGAAAADLERAARLVEGAPDVVEPDGRPNERNIPRSTLQTNIHYHLGLARYCLGDFDRAARSFNDVLVIADNDDMRVAALHWRYLALLRAERPREAERALAQVRPDMDVIENHVHHALLRHAKGEMSDEELAALAARSPVDAATIEYALGARLMARGLREQARTRFERAMATDAWAAFGAIAAEADLARMLGPSPAR